MNFSFFENGACFALGTRGSCARLPSFASASASDSFSEGLLLFFDCAVSSWVPGHARVENGTWDHPSERFRRGLALLEVGEKMHSGFFDRFLNLTFFCFVEWCQWWECASWAFRSSFHVFDSSFFAFSTLASVRNRLKRTKWSWRLGQMCGGWPWSIWVWFTITKTDILELLELCLRQLLVFLLFIWAEWSLESLTSFGLTESLLRSQCHCARSLKKKLIVLVWLCFREKLFEACGFIVEAGRQSFVSFRIACSFRLAEEGRWIAKSSMPGQVLNQWERRKKSLDLSSETIISNIIAEISGW